MVYLALDVMIACDSASKHRGRKRVIQGITVCALFGPLLTTLSSVSLPVTAFAMSVALPFAYPAYSSCLESPRVTNIILETLLVYVAMADATAIASPWRCAGILVRVSFVYLSDWPWVRVVVSGLEFAGAILSDSPPRAQLNLVLFYVFAQVAVFVFAAYALLRERRQPNGQSDAAVPSQSPQLLGVPVEEIEHGTDGMVRSEAVEVSSARPLRLGDFQEAQELSIALDASVMGESPEVRWNFYRARQMTPSGGLASITADAWEDESNASLDTYHSAESLGERCVRFHTNAWEVARLYWQAIHRREMRDWQEDWEIATEELFGRTDGMELSLMPTVLSAAPDQPQMDVLPTSRADVVLFDAVMRSGQAPSGRWWGDLPHKVRGRIAVCVGAVAGRPRARRRRADGTLLAIDENLEDDNPSSASLSSS